MLCGGGTLLPAEAVVKRARPWTIGRILLRLLPGEVGDLMREADFRASSR
jgi:hypothetical protein